MTSGRAAIAGVVDPVDVRVRDVVHRRRRDIARRERQRCRKSRSTENAGNPSGQAAPSSMNVQTIAATRKRSSRSESAGSALTSA